MSSFDEEYTDPHGECAAEIAMLRSQLSEAKEGREYWIRQTKNQATRVGAAVKALAEARAKAIEDAHLKIMEQRCEQDTAWDDAVLHCAKAVLEMR